MTDSSVSSTPYVGMTHEDSSNQSNNQSNGLSNNGFVTNNHSPSNSHGQTDPSTTLLSSPKSPLSPLTIQEVNRSNDPAVNLPKMKRFLGVDHPPGALYSLLILILINLANYIDRYIPSAVKAQIQEDFHLSDFESSLPLTIFILVYMAACPVFGYLSDRGFDRRKLMCFGVCLWSIFTALAALCDSYALFMLVRAGVGIGEASYSMIAPAIIADFYDKSTRGTILGWYYAAIPIGAALGFALGGSIGSLVGWRWAFAVIGLPGILLGLSVLTITDPERGASDVKKPSINQSISQSNNQSVSQSSNQTDNLLVDQSRSLSSNHIDEPSIKHEDETQWYVLKQLLKNPTFVIASAGQTLSTFGAGGAADWFPAYMMREFGFEEDEAGIAVGGCTVVGGLFGALLGSYMAEWWKFKCKNSYLAVAGWSSLLSAMFIFVLLLFTSLPAVIVLFLVAFSQIGLWMNIGPITAVIANVVDPRHRTRAFAVSTFFQHALGDAASPSIIGAVSDAVGLRTAAIIIPGSWILCGLVWVIGSRVVPDHQRLHHAKAMREGKDEACESVFEDMEGQDDIRSINQSFNQPNKTGLVRFRDDDDRALLIDDDQDEVKDGL